MSKSFRTILVTASTAFSALALSACGQKGDLYLPPGKAVASAPATVTAPAPAASANAPQNPISRQP